MFLAMKLHWSREAIMQLSMSELNFYARELADALAPNKT